MKNLGLIILGVLFLALTIEAQITVKGIVSDEDGPLIGVNIVEKGTTNGTVTDLDGNYMIKVAEGAILLFAYVGYEAVEIPAASTKINVTMEAAGTLDEIVVSGSKIKRHSREVTYANQTVSSNRLKKSKKSSLEALRGKLSGVKTSSGYISYEPELRTESYETIEENSFKSVANEPLSTFSVDVDRASYSNIRSYIENGQLPPKDAVRIEEMINYFEYNYPQPAEGQSINIISESSVCPWQPEHRVMMVALQGEQYTVEELPPSNLVFLLDVSGSMSSANKLPLLKQSFRFLVDQLRPEDKVSIVVYAGSSGLVLPATSGEDKIAILKSLNSLNAGGSTAGGEGIELAYAEAEKHFIKDGNNRVILATDGDFNVGVSSDNDLVNLIEQKRESGVFLTILGFGTGNYQENKMQKLAQAGNGNHMYIDNIKEARKVFTKEFTGTSFAIAKDVKLQIEFNPKNVAAYRLIGYVNRLLENEDFTDDTKDAGEMGAGHTVTAIYEIIPQGSNSAFAPKQEALKYTDSKITLIESLYGEMATVKIRFKQPDKNKSSEIVKTIDNNEALSSNESFLWSTLVAEFGMFLSASEFLPKDYKLKQLVTKAEHILQKLVHPSDEKKEFVMLLKEANKIKGTSMLED